MIICIRSIGDKSKQVHMEGYAVSGQCMALVRDNCLVPTKDAPELGYVRESSDKQFVPDVYYKVSTILSFYLVTFESYLTSLRVGSKMDSSCYQKIYKIGLKRFKNNWIFFRIRLFALFNIIFVFFFWRAPVQLQIYNTSNEKNL